MQSSIVRSARFVMAVTATFSVSLLWVGTAHAQTNIVEWNFNDGPTSGSQIAAGNAALVSDFGQAQTIDISSFAAPTGVVSFAGTTTNAINSDTAGLALAVQAGTNFVNNGGYLQFSVDTTGQQNIVVSYATQRTATGFTTQELQYSLTGTAGTFISAGTKTGTALGTSFAGGLGQQIFDLSSVTSLNNNPNVAFRLILTGGTTATGNNRFDNLLVSNYVPAASTSATPEPGAVTLLLMAGAPVLGGIKRRTRRRLA